MSLSCQTVPCPVVYHYPAIRVNYHSHHHHLLEGGGEASPSQHHHHHLLHHPNPPPGCVLQLSEEYYTAAETFKMWENVSNCLVMVAAVGALAFSNGLIVSKLHQSAKFQKQNQQRQLE